MSEKTHVLFIDTNDAMGGVVRVHLNVLECIDKSLFRVSLACQCPGPLFERFSALEDVEIVPVDTGTKPAESCGGLKGKLHDVAGLGRLAGTLARLVRYCRRENVHLIYTSDKKRAVILSTLLAHLTGRPFVYHIHSVYVDYLFNRHALREAAAVIANSVAIKRGFIAASGGQMSRIQVIHNGLDPDVFRPDIESSLPGEIGVGPDATLVGVTGRLSPEKGQDVFLRAAAEARPETDDMHFVVVGDDSIFSDNQDFIGRLHRIVDRFDLQDRVHFVGYRNDMPNVYAGLDVVVDPAWEEAFGMVVIEPMACGKTVIGSRVGGIPEIIRDGENGFLFPPGDHRVLAQTLLRIEREGEELRRRLGRAGRRTVLERFSIARQTRAMEDVFGEVAREVSKV